MPRDTTRPRSPLYGVILAVRVVFFAMLAALLLLVLSERPSLSGILKGRTSVDQQLVGLVAGHWQSDSGAVCPDGLQEVDLNLNIARKVAGLLRDEGYRVEVLPEYSPKLDGYQAAAFLSIHNDSCVAGLSGFKVVGMTHAAAPEEEDALVNLLYAHYAEATGLEPHPNTITDDMLEYHAFRQIAPETPGAIIECGFMGGDRALLTEGVDRVSSGIANGLLAFLRRETGGSTD